MSKSKQKLPTLAELRERAERVGVDISHLGRKKKEIKALLDAEVSKLAGQALTATGTGTLDYASALNSETTQDELTPRSTRKRKPVKERKSSLEGPSENGWNNFFFGGDPKSKSKKEFGPSKYFGGTGSNKKREAERKRKGDIDAFLKAKKAKGEAEEKSESATPKKRHKVPKGMTQVTVPNGYDPNHPKPLPKDSIGPRRMKCGHTEWWWEKDLCRCTKCLPKHQAYRTPNSKRR
jgi:hypothetical protein